MNYCQCTNELATTLGCHVSPFNGAVHKVGVSSQCRWKVLMLSCRCKIQSVIWQKVLKHNIFLALTMKLHLMINLFIGLTFSLSNFQSDIVIFDFLCSSIAWNLTTVRLTLQRPKPSGRIIQYVLAIKLSKVHIYIIFLYKNLLPYPYFCKFFYFHESTQRSYSHLLNNKKRMVIVLWVRRQISTIWWTSTAL